jgi:FlaA1/EpsC-like NDP-sugar epimerase
MIQAQTPLRGSRVVITGVAGTVGRALLRELIALAPRFIHGLDIDVDGLARLRTEYRAQRSVSFSETDIRRPRRLAAAMAGADAVFHAAALKDVGVCERDPADAAATNIGGTENVLDAAGHAGASRLVFLSTDKAVSPTSVMGATKLVGEHLVRSAQSRAGDGCVYSVVRFGNILGSSGSVIPVFQRQIADGGPVTVTDAAMTRFVMSVGDAIALILRPLTCGIGGDTFVARMDVMRVGDLASVLIADAARRAPTSPPVAIRTIGARPGEKRDEELTTAEEAERTIECDAYYVVPAAGSAAASRASDYPGFLRAGPIQLVHSGQISPLSPAELRAYLRGQELLQSEPARRARARRDSQWKPELTSV